ncbi:MAG TPA: endolytic transglycosylase MltG [Acidimicrobiales bacterium]|nr:endolytic transglycosylase MltG [Acidimicrobiales bacterium]
MTTLYDDEAVYEPMPPERRGGGRKVLRVVLALAVIAVLLAGAAGAYVLNQVNGSSGGEDVAVSIPMGSSTQRIAAILDDKGVVSSARLFSVYVRFTGGGPFKAGDYTLQRNSPYSKVVDALDTGPEAQVVRLTIPEGLTLNQIAERVGKLQGRSRDRFLELAKGGQVRSQFQPDNGTNLEGFLWPETYEFDPKDDELVILRRMVEAFDAAASQLGLDQSQSKVGLTPYQTIIVASMIEEEAKIAEERGKVATVIYNRIKKGETLGIDATLRYGLNRPTEPLRQSDLASDNPYNTRKLKGLPPTPIASPGRSSLEAALNPTPGPWLFYVLADRDGRHAFAVTITEFNRYKAEAQAKGLL